MLLIRYILFSVRPVISTIPEDVLIVTAGSSASLECNIQSGTPSPKISWKKKDRKMVNGEEEIFGSKLTFNDVTRHHAGVYLCLADNGFSSEPEQSEVRLSVQRKT